MVFSFGGNIVFLCSTSSFFLNLDFRQINTWSFSKMHNIAEKFTRSFPFKSEYLKYINSLERNYFAAWALKRERGRKKITWLQRRIGVWFESTSSSGKLFVNSDFNLVSKTFPRKIIKTRKLGISLLEPAGEEKRTTE